MNNIQTEKSSNKKNNQRSANYQNGQGSSQASMKTRSQDSQDRGMSQRQESANGGAMSMIPVSAISAVVTSQLVDNFAPRIFEDIKEYLMEEFGEEKVESWMTFFNGEEAGDENAIYTLIRNAVPTLPEEFSLSGIMDWAPVKARVSKNPVSAAAALAAGVGALYLTREMLKSGSFSFASVSKAVKSGKEKLTAATKGGKKKMATKARGSKRTARA